MARTTSQKQLDNREAVVSVRRWLQAEHRFLFTKNEQVDALNAPSRIESIRRSEIKSSWQEFRQLRKLSNEEAHHDRAYHLKATKSVLEACALGHTMFVLTGMARGYKRALAERASWDVQDKFIGTIQTGQKSLPERTLLYLPVEDAIEQYTGVEGAYGRIDLTISSLAALAMTAVAEQAGLNKGQQVLPEPGPIGSPARNWDQSDLSLHS